MLATLDAQMKRKTKMQSEQWWHRRYPRGWKFRATHGTFVEASSWKWHAFKVKTGIRLKWVPSQKRAEAN